MKNKKDNKKINYTYTEEIKTNIEKPTEEQLINLFNEKFFKTIMKIEKENIEDYKV